MDAPEIVGYADGEPIYADGNTTRDQRILADYVGDPPDLVAAILSELGEPITVDDVIEVRCRAGYDPRTGHSRPLAILAGDWPAHARELVASGVGVRETARRAGVSHTTVRRWLGRA